MEDLNVANGISNASNWLAKNQDLLVSYAVNIAAAIVIIIVGMIAARLISGAVNRLMRARNLDATVADFLSSLVRYGVIAFTFIAALGRVGVETASVIAVLGAAGLAVGLALQGSLSNLAAGVLLVAFRPFRTGDFIDIGVLGTVLNVQIFSTTLKTADGKIVVVPNGKIIAGDITNYSREPSRRNEFIINVASHADVDDVMALLREVVEAEPRVQQELGIQIGLNEMTPSSMGFIVRCWSKAADLQQVYWDLMRSFKLALNEKNIAAPRPQMGVYMHQDEKQAYKEL